MAATIIDGKRVATALKAQLSQDISALKTMPTLAVILVGDDPASQVYVRNKITACETVGIESLEYKLPADTTAEDLLKLIAELNNDPKVNGILLQLPLPKHLNENDMVNAIDPAKDVDGLHPLNAGKLMAGIDGMVACTPQGSLLLIKEIEKDLSGKHAVIIGRSLLFGKPMGQLLLAENCTVTQCHSRTKNLPEMCKQADILVAAVGQPQMVKADWVKEGAIVIDVGINRIETEEGKTKLVGDVDFEAVKNVAGAITPVPGGVGPMTIACLLSNTVKAAKNVD